MVVLSHLLLLAARYPYPQEAVLHNGSPWTSLVIAVVDRGIELPSARILPSGQQIKIRA